MPSASAPRASGSLARRSPNTDRTGSHLHTVSNGTQKRARLDLDHDAPQERLSDGPAREDEHKGFMSENEDTVPIPRDNDTVDPVPPDDDTVPVRPDAGTQDADGTTASDDPAPASTPSPSQQHDLVGNASCTGGSCQCGSCPGDNDNQQGNGDAYTRPDVHPDDLPGGPNDWCPDDLVPHLDALRTSVEFIRGISHASLDTDPLPSDVLERLQFPITEPLVIDKYLRLSLDAFLVSINGSQATYDGFCNAIRRFAPDAQPLSYNCMKQTVTDLTGVVSVMTDMCYNSCVAFSGPFSDLSACPECSSP
jgi:hypothetical protein